MLGVLKVNSILLLQKCWASFLTLYHISVIFLCHRFVTFPANSCQANTMVTNWLLKVLFFVTAQLNLNRVGSDKKVGWSKEHHHPNVIYLKPLNK